MWGFNLVCLSNFIGDKAPEWALSDTCIFQAVFSCGTCLVSIVNKLDVWDVDTYQGMGDICGPALRVPKKMIVLLATMYKEIFGFSWNSRWEQQSESRQVSQLFIFRPLFHLVVFPQCMQY